MSSKSGTLSVFDLLSLAASHRASKRGISAKDFAALPASQGKGGRRRDRPGKADSVPADLPARVATLTDQQRKKIA